MRGNVLIEHDDWIEIEGSSREDALERACTALNTTRKHLAYEQVDGPGYKIRARKLNEAKDGFEDEEDVEAEEPVDAAPSEKRPPRKAHAERPVEPDTRDYEKLAQEGHDILKEILKHIAHETEIFVEQNDEEIVLEIEADGSGLFIGKHGQMLEALQHLVAKILGLDRSSSKRLIVDSEGYRARRQMSLEVLAKRMAAKAKRNQRSVTLEPMTAMDRRVIHLALSFDRQVTTKSVGEGAERKIIIMPKKGSGDRGRGGRGRNGRGGRGGFGDRDGNRSGRGRHQQRRAGPQSNRMHDSYDVPAEPKMDIFPDNIDEMMDSGFEEE